MWLDEYAKKRSKENNITHQYLFMQSVVGRLFLVFVYVFHAFGNEYEKFQLYNWMEPEGTLIKKFLAKLQAQCNLLDFYNNDYFQFESHIDSQHYIPLLNDLLSLFSECAFSYVSSWKSSHEDTFSKNDHLKTPEDLTDQYISKHEKYIIKRIKPNTPAFKHYSLDRLATNNHLLQANKDFFSIYEAPVARMWLQRDIDILVIYLNPLYQFDTLLQKYSQNSGPLHHITFPLTLVQSIMQTHSEASTLHSMNCLGEIFASFMRNPFQNAYLKHIMKEFRTHFLVETPLHVYTRLIEPKFLSQLERPSTHRALRRRRRPRSFQNIPEPTAEAIHFLNHNKPSLRSLHLRARSLTKHRPILYRHSESDPNCLILSFYNNKESLLESVLIRQRGQRDYKLDLSSPRHYLVCYYISNWSRIHWNRPTGLSESIQSIITLLDISQNTPLEYIKPVGVELPADADLKPYRKLIDYRLSPLPTCYRSCVNSMLTGKSSEHYLDCNRVVMSLNCTKRHHSSYAEELPPYPSKRKGSASLSNSYLASKPAAEQSDTTYNHSNMYIRQTEPVVSSLRITAASKVQKEDDEGEISHEDHSPSEEKERIREGYSGNIKADVLRAELLQVDENNKSSPSKRSNVYDEGTKNKNRGHRDNSNSLNVTWQATESSRAMWDYSKKLNQTKQPPSFLHKSVSQNVTPARKNAFKYNSRPRMFLPSHEYLNSSSMDTDKSLTLQGLKPKSSSRPSPFPNRISFDDPLAPYDDQLLVPNQDGDKVLHEQYILCDSSSDSTSHLLGHSNANNGRSRSQNSFVVCSRIEDTSTNQKSFSAIVVNDDSLKNTQEGNQPPLNLSNEFEEHRDEVEHVDRSVTPNRTVNDLTFSSVHSNHSFLAISGASQKASSHHSEENSPENSVVLGSGKRRKKESISSDQGKASTQSGGRNSRDDNFIPLELEEELRLEEGWDQKAPDDTGVYSKEKQGSLRNKECTNMREKGKKQSSKDYEMKVIRDISPIPKHVLTSENTKKKTSWRAMFKNFFGGGESTSESEIKKENKETTSAEVRNNLHQSKLREDPENRIIRNGDFDLIESFFDGSTFKKMKDPKEKKLILTIESKFLEPNSNIRRIVPPFIHAEPRSDGEARSISPIPFTK